MLVTTVGRGFAEEGSKTACLLSLVEVDHGGWPEAEGLAAPHGWAVSARAQPWKTHPPPFSLILFFFLCLVKGLTLG